MAEKPIIFSTPEVQAILAGRKTQTRQVIKNINNMENIDDMWFVGRYKEAIDMNGKKLVDEHFTFRYRLKSGNEFYDVWCPLEYHEGDILCVRETFCEAPYGMECVKTKNVIISFPKIAYKADGEDDYTGLWRPSIHMPRKAARLFLLVTDVRAERVQEISEADAKAEGIRSYFMHKEHGGEWHESNGQYVGIDDNTHPTRKQAFSELWDSLNAKRGYGWDANPWVWVYTFERMDNK